MGGVLLNDGETTMAVMVELPDEIYERFQRIADLTGQDIESILALPSILFMNPVLRELDPTPISELSDFEVLTLADSRMDKVQYQRMRELSEKRQDQGLTESEQNEFNLLFEIYNIGELRMAKAISEATKRGLIP
jgi:hypothetical protein